MEYGDHALARQEAKEEKYEKAWIQFTENLADYATGDERCDKSPGEEYICDPDFKRMLDYCPEGASVPCKRHGGSVSIVRPEDDG